MSAEMCIKSCLLRTCTHEMDHQDAPSALSHRNHSLPFSCALFFLFSHSLTFDMNSTAEFSLSSGDKPSISKPRSIFSLTP